MTWSRRVSRGGDGARSLGWDVVAAGSAGFVDEVLFAPQLGQAVAGLADGLAAVIDTREGVHLGNELGDGEPVRRWRQRQGGAQRVSHAAFVEVDTADPVLTRMATGHTRYPVVGADDDPGGVIHLRDLLDPDARFGTAETRCRPAVFVPTTLPLPNVVRLRTLGTAGSPSRARRLLGRHVPVLGGTASAAGSARAGARESRRLGALLSGMGTADLATALTSIGLEDLVGQDRFSVLDALITFIAGDGDDLDAQAARDAACDVLEDLFGNADQWADLASINVTADDLNRMLEMFLSLYVYNRVPVIAERLSRLDNPAQSRHADQEMRLIIADMVAIHLPEDPFTIDWRGGAGPGLGRRRDRQCLRSVERADRSWFRVTTTYTVRTHPHAAEPSDADVRLLDWRPGASAATIQIGAGGARFFDGWRPPADAVDLLLLGAAAYCADKTALRRASRDCWTRDITLELPVRDPDAWHTVDWAAVLNFLTGDLWTITPSHSDADPLSEIAAVPDTQTSIGDVDAVCLFSGALDSLTGVIDLLETQTATRICLLSHNEGGQASTTQDTLIALLTEHFGPDRLITQRL